MYEELKETLCCQHRKIAELNIDFLNDGLISVFDYKEKCFAIKGKSSRSDTVTPKEIVILNEHAEVVEGEKKEFDERFYTHYILYKNYALIRCIIQLDSRWTGIWAQLGKRIPPMSSLHAKYFFGEIPCTADLDWTTEHKNLFTRLGESVVETLENRVEGHMQAAIIRNMGAIVWGSTPENAVNNAVALEEIAFRALQAHIIEGTEWQYLPYAMLKKFFFENGVHSGQILFNPLN